jgi:hypothetical protein
MATEHGLDIGGILDISATFKVVRGRKALADAIGRRLTTPRGGLFYDLNYGHDVRQYLNAPLPQAGVIEAQVSAECLKDERVQDVTVDVVRVDESVSLSLTIVDEQGPFRLTLSVTSVTSELLLEAA